MKRRLIGMLAFLSPLPAAQCEPAPRVDANPEPSRQETPVAPDDRFLGIGADSLHYLDFGGAGLPLVFTAGSRPAAAWSGFASRFTDRHRVLAVTDRGVGPSRAPRQWGSVERRGDDIIALLDALDISRAVLVANANPAPVLVYLAENYPDRLAGLVFLAPGSEVGMNPARMADDPSGAARMVARGFASMQGRDPDGALDEATEAGYTPRYLLETDATIAVPTLTFVNLEGTRGIDRVVVFIETAKELADSTGVIPENVMPDSIARAWLGRLAVDETLQAEVRTAWESSQAPAIRANEQAFFDAFEDLRAVRIDVPLLGGVPVVQGYEYASSPALIEPHIRQFLEDLSD